MTGPLILIGLGLALGYASYLHYYGQLISRKGLHGMGPGMTHVAFIDDRVAANLHFIRTGKSDDNEHYWS